MDSNRDLRARRPQLSCMQLLTEILDELGDDVLALTIVAVSADGDSAKLYSNARSEAEMNGMLHMALEYQNGIVIELDEDGD